MCAAVGDMEYRLAEEQDFSQVSTFIFYDTVTGTVTFFHLSFAALMDFSSLMKLGF